MPRFSLILRVVLLACCSTIAAQDPQFSQFFANRVYLNPAYAGFDPGWTVELNHRDQWFGVPDASSGPFSGGYRLSSVALSNQAPCAFNLQGANFGYSFVAFNDQAGIAGLETKGLGLAVSLEVPLIGERKERNWKKSGLTRLDLRFGAQHSIAQRSLADDYFIYSDQLDPVLGLLDANPPNGLDLMVPTYQNSKVGLMLRGALRLGQPKKRGRVRENDRILFTAGLAISNVQEPDISFFEGANPAILPRRLTIHLGTAFSMLRLQGGRKGSKYLSVAPQFRWDTQMNGLLNTITFGANFFQRTTYLGAFYSFNTPNGVGPGAISLDPILAGGVRSLTITGGMQFKLKNNYHTTYRNRRRGEQNLQFALSYDLIAGGLQRTTGGVLELSCKANIFSGQWRDCAELGRFELYKGDCPAKF